VIFQSVAERQYAKWTNIVQLRPTCSTIFIFSSTLTQKLLNRFSPFLHDIWAISDAINACIRKMIVHFVSEHESREWRWSIVTLAKSPKNNLLPQHRSLDYCKTYVSFIIRNTETLLKTCSVVVEIFGDIGQFRQSRSTMFIFYPTLTQKLLNWFSPSFHTM